jgi:hypothetical protein
VIARFTRGLDLSTHDVTERPTVTGIRCAVVLTFLAWSSVSTAQEGIAARYPRDVGIERDSDVIITEMFERSSAAEIASGWTNSQNTPGCR